MCSIAKSALHAAPFVSLLILIILLLFSVKNVKKFQKSISTLGWEIDSREFYKLGFTSRSIKKRYGSIKSMPYEFVIVQEIKDLAKNIWELELLLKRYLKSVNILYKPTKQFNGDCTECFLFKD